MAARNPLARVARQRIGRRLGESQLAKDAIQFANLSCLSVPGDTKFFKTMLLAGEHGIRPATQAD